MIRGDFASGEKSTERAKLLAKYFPELFSLIIQKIILFEKHNNQLVANNYFIEHLKRQIIQGHHISQKKMNKKIHYISSINFIYYERKKFQIYYIYPLIIDVGKFKFILLSQYYIYIHSLIPFIMNIGNFKFIIYIH